MPDILKFCRPEEVGVSPDWVSDYIRTLNSRRKMCHSFLMIRHGKVFAEGYWKPFSQDMKHRMYSVSKSFVSGAIGMLIDEGRIKLTDKIVDYFPDKLPEKLHPLIAEMTIRDMLMMATCHNHTTYTSKDMDWIATFFDPHHEPDHRAGTEFKYDTSASYTLDVLVERLTGKPFLEYMKDKVLRDIGFSEDAWCVEAPEGYSWGGSGVICTTRDLARYALLFANYGQVNGKQYISEEYARAATSKQIENNRNRHGYGYQIWRERKDSFAFNGMGGQYALIVPSKDFVFVCTSDSQGDPEDYNGIPNLIWETVINKISDDSLPMDDYAYRSLEHLISKLDVSVPFGDKYSPNMEKINGKTFKLEENRMGMDSFEISFTGEGGVLTYHTSRGDKKFPFGLARYEDTTFPETHYSGKRINEPANREYRCLNAGVWQDEETFMLKSYVIDDYFGNMAATFTFFEDGVRLKITKVAEWFMDEYVGEARGKVQA